MSAKDDIAAYLTHLDTGGVDIDQIIFDELAHIVRCRDCRYHVSVTDGDVCRKPCGDEAAGRVWVEPDGFCAWGRQRSK